MCGGRGLLRCLIRSHIALLCLVYFCFAVIFVRTDVAVDCMNSCVSQACWRAKAGGERRRLKGEGCWGSLLAQVLRMSRASGMTVGAI